MNSYTKLVKNSMIFAVGNLGSRLISVLLVPIYTHYLSSNEYGSIDLIVTTVTMLIPIVSISMYDAVLRFSMDKEIDNKIVLTNSLIVSGAGIILSAFLVPIIKQFDLFGDNLFLIYILMMVQIIEMLLAQYTRGIGMSKTFAINGIILTFNMGILNIVFLIALKLGLRGYLISLIIAYILSIVYLCIQTRTSLLFKFSSYNKKLSHSMIKYALPLIPNSLMWAAINSSSRYFIFYFVGLSGNGLFAVASKIPLIINVISQVFSQAWQLSAIEEAKNENVGEIYSNTFSVLSSVMFIGSSIVITILKPLFFYAFSSEYYNAWQSTPFLLLGAVFSSFSNFLGATYIANKETKGVFKTSIWGGATSLLCNTFLIPYVGIVGAGISSLLSFVVMFVMRLKDTNKYFNMKIDFKKNVITLVIILLQIINLHMNIWNELEFFINIGLFILLLNFNRNIFTILIIPLKKYKDNFKNKTQR